MDFGFTGKIALVTGAAGGIGRAIAELIAEEGAKVYLADLDERGASSAASALTSAGRSAVGIALDVGDEKSVQAVVDAIVSREGHLDVAINNAGILRSNALESSTVADWEALSRINVGGVFTCCKAEAEAMSAQRAGKILNLGSVSAFKGGGSVGSALYGASKAAVHAITLGFAREYGPKGVNVNAIAPAVTETPMTQALFEKEGTRARILQTIPLRRLSELREIASLAAFLVSDLAGYMNGAIVVVDGGLMTV
ncbi:MAG: SDR family NAD(P)-dependent oxidoreductase [Vulcanimicrobiaceae bacterium]